MTIYIKVTPTEKGTAVVEMTFTDEDENLVTPTELQWQLMLPDKTIVNNRTFILNPFIAIDGVAVVALTKDDLAVINGNKKRVFSLQGVYDSDAGNDLAITDEISFSIRKLVGQVDV